MKDLRDQLKQVLVDRYAVERELGRGGMATVYLAEDLKHARKVAIKVLHPELAAVLGPDRFLREIQIAARLQHPHILPLLDSGQADSFLYYVMPFVAGESLRARLGREHELPVGDVVRILREVVDALAYAHSQGLIHRDIKPDNVLLSGRHALVTDFGVAKAISEATGRQQLTTAGVALGTPAYMAPEQAAGETNLDQRVDIYAVGVMAYELLCGRTPFTSTTAQGMLAAHVTEQAEPVTRHRPAVPPQLGDAIMRCLEKKPADRWQTSEELLNQFEALSTSTGGITPTDTRPFVAQPAMDRTHPLRVAGLFALAAVGVLTIVYGAVHLIGLPDWVLYGAIALLVAGLPIMLLTGRHERRRALARSRGHVAATPPGVARLFTWRKATLGGVIAFAALAVLTGVYMAMRALGIGTVGTLLASGALDRGGRIVLANFADHTGDSTLATTFTEAMRIDLGQSRVVSLLSPAEIREAFQRMERDPNSTLTLDVAREIAVRNGLKAVVTGEINRAGGGYVVSAKLVDPEHGDAIIAFRETARDSTQLIPTVDRLSRKLRERIGESLRAIRSSPPLGSVTTSSLPALRKYSEAGVAYNRADYLRSIALYREAIALDTTFAMAYRRLATYLGNLGLERTAQVRYMTQAFKYRERLPELERLLVTGSYQANVTGDYGAAVETYRRALEVDSTNSTALNNIAVYLRELRDYPTGESLLVRLAQRYSEVELYWGNVAENQRAVGNFKQARETLRQEEQALPGHPQIRWHRIQLALSEGNFDSVDRLLKTTSSVAADPIETRETLHFRMILAGLRGELREAQALADERIRLAEQLNAPMQAVAVQAELSRFAVELQGPSGEQVKRVASVLARFPLARMDPLDRPYLPLAMFYLRAGRLDRTKEMVATYERDVPAQVRPGEGRSDLLWLQTRGWMAIEEKRFAEAIARFREADQGSCFVCALPGLARAYEFSGEPDSAFAVYQRYLTGATGLYRPEERLNLPGVYLHFAELSERRGRRDAAIQYYGKLAELWKNADPELQPIVKDVKQRMARLSGERR